MVSRWVSKLKWITRPSSSQELYRHYGEGFWVGWCENTLWLGRFIPLCFVKQDWHMSWYCPPFLWFIKSKWRAANVLDEHFDKKCLQGHHKTFEETNDWPNQPTDIWAFFTFTRQELKGYTTMNAWDTMCKWPNKRQENSDVKRTWGSSRDNTRAHHIDVSRVENSRNTHMAPSALLYVQKTSKNVCAYVHVLIVFSYKWQTNQTVSTKEPAKGNN